MHTKADFQMEAAATKRWLKWGLIWLIAGFSLWYLILRDGIEQYKFIRDKQVTAGTLLEVQEAATEVHDEEERPIYKVKYSYTSPEGRVITKWAHESSGAFFDNYPSAVINKSVPSPIEVEFLPKHPATSRIRGAKPATITEWLVINLIWIPYAMLVLCGIGWTMVREARSEMKSRRAKVTTSKEG